SNTTSAERGVATTTNRPTPVAATGLGAGSGLVAIAAGGNEYTLALKSDGSVLAWGFNGNGELGDGTTTNRTTPVGVTGLGAGSGVVAISAGEAHSLALKSDGSVLAWGYNCSGRQRRRPGAQVRRQRARLGYQRLRPAGRRHHHQPHHPGGRHRPRCRERGGGHRRR